MRRRSLLVGLCLLVALVALSAYVLTTSLRNAPLSLGSGGTAVTPAAATPLAGELPLGAPGRDLALMSNQAGHWDLVLLAADGTPTTLTPDTADAPASAQDYFPSWSLDGQQLNFLSNRQDAATLGPAQVRADGSDLRTLDLVSAIMTMALTGRFDWDPVWSPDSTQLAWSSVRDTNLELYVIPLAAEFAMSNARRLTNRPARDWFAAWSPDGTQLVHASDVAGNEDLYVLDVATGSSRALTVSAWDDFRGAWSLDGTRILYLSDENDDLTRGQLHLYLIDPAGGTPQPFAPEARFSGGAVWSPDGGQVAYFSNETGRWQVYVMNRDGSARRRVTPADGDYLYPVWRP